MIVAKDEIFASCSWSSLGIEQSLTQHLQDEMGFQVPTLVQAQAIPVVLSGRHLLVKAATGTGKTIAYLAPIINQLQKINPRIDRTAGTFALVLVPTQELCTQVYETLEKLRKRFNFIVPGFVMGGDNRSKEKARLRKGISILVATPGRLLDHLQNTASFMHTNLRWIIFDEADRILELGLGEQIKQILNLLGSTGNVSQRQHLLFSATLNDKVNQLAKISLENPVTIGIDEKISAQASKPSEKSINSAASDEDEESKADGDYNLPTQLVQTYVKVPGGLRLVVLLSVLNDLFAKQASHKIVVFFSTCDSVDFHYSLLNDFQWPSKNNSKVVKCKTFQLHGNMERNGRRTTFQEFKTAESALLLCTDVAARGLDFPKVTYIIQYDSPGEASEYVHRVGRTARLGEKGDALLFLQPSEISYLQELKQHGVSLKEFPLIKFLDNFPSYSVQKHAVKKYVSIDMHPWVLSVQKHLENFISTEGKMKQLAKDAFCSWMRAYTTHRAELKAIFQTKELHIGHVAKSFGLREAPSVVGKSFQLESKKRKKDEKQKHKGNYNVKRQKFGKKF